MVNLKRVGAFAVAMSAALVLTACGSGSSSDEDSGPATAASGNAKCEAKKIGDFTRCENFYEDYWPTINKNLDALYKEAKTTDGGQLVIWDWYELSPDVIAQFHKRFPDIKIKTRGMTYNVPSAVISAKATGQRNTDIVSGSITSMTAMYDEKFWDKVDWTAYGVPKEFFNVGAPELMPDSFNGGLINYNSNEIKTPPTTLDELTAPEYKGKVAIAGYNAQHFAAYGMKNGQDKMEALIKKLKDSGNLAVVEDTGQLLSSGDKPIAVGGQLFNPQPELSVAPFEDSDLYAQFSGVNSDAKNKPAAKLWVLWNAFDPDWLNTRLTDEKFATSAMPYPGLPTATFAKATGLTKKNIDAWTEALDKGWGVIETQKTRDDINAMIAAADKALNN